MDRRTFLRSLGVLAGATSAGGVMAACGDGGASAGAPTGQPTLSMITASLETLTGQDRRFAFGLFTIDNTPVKADDVQVYLREVEGEVISGPHPAEFHDDGESPFGVYVTRLDFAEPGMKELVAVHGSDFGTDVINVVTPEQSQLPVPGDEAIVVPTPTTSNDMGLAELCTQDPPCGMHEVSLDEAVAAGQPVALLFATPAYCQTAVCGPSVATLDAVRQEVDDPEVAFIHVEIFSDEGVTLTDPVEAWGLPSEPWLFTIDRDGRIAGRLDGPMVRAIVTDLVSGIRTA